jgi:nitroreductase
MEALLAIASKRDVREYAETPVARETQDRILDAGRLSGSARNRQPWRFVVAEGEAARLTLARAVYRPEVVMAAPFSLLVAGLPGSALTLMDIGRAAQNMMLCAWDLGVVSCPHGLADPSALAPLLDSEAGESPGIAMSFGYPRVERDPARRSLDAWSDGARRLPLTTIVRRA